MCVFDAFLAHVCIIERENVELIGKFLWAQKLFAHPLWRKFMNKSELIGAIAEKTGSTRTDSERFMNAFVGIVRENLANKDDVRILGFGTLGVVKRKARTGRNPATGEIMHIESRYTPFFKAGKELKEVASSLSVEDDN